MLALATLGLAANYIGFLLGLDHTSPANAQVLIQLGPLLLALGGLLVFRERFAPAQWLGFGAIVVGLGAFFASQLVALGREIDRYLVGVAWIGFAAVTWAIYGLAQKQLLQVLSSQAVMLCIYAGCALCFAPWFDAVRVRRTSPRGVGNPRVLLREHVGRVRRFCGRARTLGGVAGIGRDRPHAARDARLLDAGRATPARTIRDGGSCH